MGAVDQGMSHVQDRDNTSSTEPAKSGSHARDIRFAGAVSAGLVSAILVGGALLAPTPPATPYRTSAGRRLGWTR